MALLLLDRAQLRIKTEGDTLALYEAGERRGTVPLALIDRCVVHGAQTQLDSGVLMRLAEAGVTTVLMSPRQPRRFALVLGTGHNDAAVRLAQGSRVLDPAWCERWAHGLVLAKLQRQRRNLRLWMAARPDARKPLFDALATLDPLLQALRQAHPASPSTLSTLRGQEGAAARAYFGGLAGVLPPAFGFSGRNRRPPRDPANVCLSLAYTMLHTQAVRACCAAGLDPLLGFYHRPAFGRESLASDLIEPLRPVVDHWLWELLRARTLRDEHFSLDKGACLMGKAGRQIFYAQWEAWQRPVQRWLRLRTRALARSLRELGEPWLVSGNEDDDEAAL